MEKFCFLLLTCFLISLSSFISIHLFYQDVFDKRIPSQHYENSAFFSKSSESFNFSDIQQQSNIHYLYKFSPLDIDSTSKLNLSHYKCKPVTFGYSKLDGQRVFLEEKYPECSSVTGVHSFKASIDRVSNTLSLSCKADEKGYFFAGPVAGKSLMKKEDVEIIDLHEYRKSLNSSNIEYILGICEKKELKVDKNNIDSQKLQHASMRPVFDPDLFSRNVKMVKEKPLIIFLLTLDSLSRRHFYRKLPKLVKYLNQSEQLLPDFALFDFKLHSTFGSDSVRNQLPIFGGKNYKRMRNPFQDDTLGSNSMWSQMKKKGFITFMGLDDCDKWFPKVLGDNIQVDYSVRQFYCLIDKYVGIRTEKNETEQRCLGPRQTHYYLLNYTLELAQLYKGTNMWISLHLNAGHEKTGQHAATLDADLLPFLKAFLETTRKSSEVFLFLGADHGMRYGHWYNSIDSHQETKLPALFLLASKSLLDRHQFSYHSLHENTERLTSKLDIRKTILYLIGENDFEPAAVNLINQIASYGRTCEDLQSNLLYCACSPISEIKDYNETIQEIISLIQNKAEGIVNKMSYYFPSHPPGQYCDFVSLNKVLKFYHMEVDKDIEIFKLEFGSLKHPSLKLEVTSYISSNSFLITEKHKSTFPPFRFATRNYQYSLRVTPNQIAQISRLDKYSGKCQSLAESQGILPEYCIRDKC